MTSHHQWRWVIKVQAAELKDRGVKSSTTGCRDPVWMTFWSQKRAITSAKKWMNFKPHWALKAVKGTKGRRVHKKQDSPQPLSLPGRQCEAVSASVSMKGSGVCHTSRKVRDAMTLQLSAKAFLQYAATPSFLSPRQHGRGQYSAEHCHYSGQWLGLICHECEQNHFQESFLRLQPRMGTRWGSPTVVTAADGTP